MALMKRDRLRNVFHRTGLFQKLSNFFYDRALFSEYSIKMEMRYRKVSRWIWDNL